jgi:hypothetical protein
MYRAKKLWEDIHADAASAELTGNLARAMQRQRAMAIERIAGRGGFFSGILRVLLAVGAIVWFPFVQPVLEIMLQPGAKMPRIALLIVQLLGVTYLLKSALFLAIWFLVLWLALRWNTQRRVNRLLSSTASTDLAQVILDWIDALLDPIRSARERMDDVVQRTNALRDSIPPIIAATHAA